MESQIASWLTLPILYESTQECERVRALFRSGMKQLVQSYPVESIEDVDAALQVCSGRTNFQLAYQQQNDLELQKDYGQWLSSILALGLDSIQPRPCEPSDRIRVGFVSLSGGDTPLGSCLEAG